MSEDKVDPWAAYLNLSDGAGGRGLANGGQVDQRGDTAGDEDRQILVTKKTMLNPEPYRITVSEEEKCRSLYRSLNVNLLGIRIGTESF